MAPGPLDGFRVLDIGSIIAGPFVGTLLGDFGADVIKIEHPKGDPLRSHGQSRLGVSLLWKVIGRNKRTATLDLSTRDGQQLFRTLSTGADVIVESFRPGTLERWNLAPSDLLAANPRLVILRTSGFGQFGPHARRPFFGTLAEAMSGFAHMTGERDGPPTLPPFGLADGVAGLAGAVAVTMALLRRESAGGSGQVIDLAIVEPLLSILGAQATTYDQLGIAPGRMGNRTSNNAPRNVYLTRDGKWVAVSSSAHSVAKRVMTLVGAPGVTREPWFESGQGRAAHGEELDAAVSAWIATRDRDEVLREFAEANAAAAPVYDISEALTDPQLAARETFTRLSDPELGTVLMQNVMFRMSETPGSIRWAGRPIGHDNLEVLAEIGLSSSEVARLRGRGVV